MPAHAYTEDQLVEQPTIGLFAELGWTTVSALEETFGAAGTFLCETKGEVVLVSRLRAALERLNPALPTETIITAVDEMTRDRSAMSMLSGQMNFLLAIIRRSYVEFEKRAGQVKAPRGAKTDLVQAAIEAQAGPFRVSDIQHACPSVSLDMIRQVLKNLRSSKVECLGRGQNAKWQKLANG